MRRYETKASRITLQVAKAYMSFLAPRLEYGAWYRTYLKFEGGKFGTFRWGKEGEEGSREFSLLNQILVKRYRGEFAVGGGGGAPPAPAAPAALDAPSSPALPSVSERIRLHKAALAEVSDRLSKGTHTLIDAAVLFSLVNPQGTLKMDAIKGKARQKEAVKMDAIEGKARQKEAVESGPITSAEENKLTSLVSSLPPSTLSHPLWSAYQEETDDVVADIEAFKDQLLALRCLNDARRDELRAVRRRIKEMERLEAELNVMKDCWSVNRPEEVGQGGEWLGTWEGAEQLTLVEQSKSEEGDGPSPKPAAKSKRKKKGDGELKVAKLRFTAVGEAAGGPTSIPSFVSPTSGSFIRR